MSDNLHPCPATGCDKTVPIEVLACKAHWFQLPIEVRRGISRNWRANNLTEWMGWRKLAIAILTGQYKVTGGIIVDADAKAFQ